MYAYAYVYLFMNIINNNKYLIITITNITSLITYIFVVVVVERE